MANGIIYVMETVVPGLVKIGKTGTDNFNSRMYQLERHGYSNVVGLKRRFAIEVEDYDEKEKLISDIFSKSKLYNSELFALDIDLVIQLLSSFEGKQIYPEKESKEEIFDKATKERVAKLEYLKIPDGLYILSMSRKNFGKVEAKMMVEQGTFTILKGSICAPPSKNQKSKTDKVREGTSIKNNVLLENFLCTSPSMAAWVAYGGSVNGWTSWMGEDGHYIDVYRPNNEVE